MAATPKFWCESGRGRKQCPSCQKYNSVRATICQNPKCKKPLPIATPKNTKRRGKSPIDLIQAIPTVKELGGVAKTRKIIAAVEEGLETLKPLGDLKTAKETLDLIEELKGL